MEVTTMSQAMQLHGQALKLGAQPHNQDYSEVFTFSALSPSGDLNYARLILNSLRTTNSYYWNTMLRAYCETSDAYQSISLFLAMHKEHSSACRNAGWVTKAGLHFKDMKMKYGITPNLQHHGCMVDLYARSGKLKEAEDFIRKMAIPPDAVLWRTLIWACKIHGNTDRAKHLIKEMNIDLDECDSYVLVINIYASAGKWRDKAVWRETMNKKGLVKPPGSSKIEVDGDFHEFTAGNSTHIEAHNIYEKLEEIYDRLKGEGYKPELSEVLLEVDDEEKDFQLLYHSEKLAVAFGLMKMKPTSEIRIVKNLRSCEDCHSFMKLISRAYGRDIIVRDRIRFHHFRNGDCSCEDYW